MASEGLYLDWAQVKDGPVFYIPATMFEEALNRKIRDQIKPAISVLRDKIVAAIGTEEDPTNMAHKVASLLIALNGEYAGGDGLHINGLAREAAELLQKLADFEMIKRNLVKGATYVLDQNQLKEYGL